MWPDSGCGGDEGCGETRSRRKEGYEALDQESFSGWGTRSTLSQRVLCFVLIGMLTGMLLASFCSLTAFLN